MLAIIRKHFKSISPSPISCVCAHARVWTFIEFCNLLNFLCHLSHHLVYYNKALWFDPEIRGKNKTATIMLSEWKYVDDITLYELEEALGK